MIAVDADDKIVHVRVDLAEPMRHARRHDDDVARADVPALSVLNRLTGSARSDQDRVDHVVDRHLARVRDRSARDEGPRPVDDVIHLGDLRMVDRALLRGLRRPMLHADGDVVFPHVDDADLLIEDAIGRRLGDHGADVGVGYVGCRAHRRGRLETTSPSRRAPPPRESSAHLFSSFLLVVAYYTLIIRFFSLLALTASRRAAGARRGSWSRVAALYRQRLQQAGIVGSSLLFVRNGEVAHKAFDGFQDRATKRPVDDDTIYHWASITKTFTGIAIMQLRDRGLLSLDDPVVKYVPELRQIHNPFGASVNHDPAPDDAQLRVSSRDLAVGRRPAVASVRAHPLGTARRDAACTRSSCSRQGRIQLSNPGVISLAASSSCCRATTTRSTSRRTS